MRLTRSPLSLWRSLSGALSLSIHDALFFASTTLPPFLYTGYSFFSKPSCRRGGVRGIAISMEGSSWEFYGSYKRGEIIGPYFKISLDAHMSG